MKTKIVSQLDAGGYFVCPVEADESPLEPGVFLFPGGAVDASPPLIQSGKRARWNGASFVMESIPAPPPAPVLSLDDLRAAVLAMLPTWEAVERAAGIDHAGRKWLTTPAALQDIRDVLIAEAAPPGGVWIDAARQPAPMTLADLKALWGAIFARGAAIYQRRIEMEQAIATMSRADLESFKPGWPAKP